ncbi:unnamed protein product [Auanema sp. JU1783]|nr:unnamed protein product [Auanema sp. JU1783]
MDGIAFLTVLSGAMFLGSYIAGSIPLLFPMSESRLRIVSIFGAGLLIGTALAVILPEGVEALYNSQQSAHHHDLSSLHNEMDANSILKASESKSAIELPRVAPPDPNIQDRKNKRNILETVIETHIESDETVRVKRSSDEHESHSHGNTANIHKEIGYSLVIGFIFMLLVDQISSCAISRDDRNGRNRMGISATIGLVVHAAADGIALGSASTINKADVQLIVFIAIMLHKGPAAFGLVSFLLVEKIDIRNIRKHLLVFSLAAPFGAFFTYLIIQHSGDSLASESSTGMLMLFSAGTFLYVATVHVLPELANQSKHSEDSFAYNKLVDVQSPASAGHSHAGGTTFTMKELGAIIAGAIVPAFLASGHSH